MQQNRMNTYLLYINVFRTTGLAHLIQCDGLEQQNYMLVTTSKKPEKKMMIINYNWQP